MKQFKEAILEYPTTIDHSIANNTSKNIVVQRAYKFRIYPNKTQQKQLYLEFAASKTVYNYFLNQSIELYKLEKKSSNYFDWAKKLTDLKKEKEFTWLQQASSGCLQQSIKDLDKAYKNFFRNIKKGTKPGFPNFKKFNSSVRYSNVSCKYSKEKHKIQLSKCGWINVVDYKNPHGKLMNMTVSKSKSGKWYVSICVEQQTKKYDNNSNSEIGIDVGIKDFLVDSNGNKISNPTFLKNQDRKIKRLQRQLSKKKIGSNNRKKVKLKLAKAHDKIQEQRKNFLHQNSTKLTKENNFIATEDLNVSGMLKNHKLAKSIQEVSWSEFFRMLTYKGVWYNCKIKKIGRFEPSSKTCNNCGYVKKEMSLKEREWVCPQCNTKLDRDVNAAKNILKIALDIKEEVVI